MKFPTTSLEWLQTLVSFDTTSRNSNLELISLIKEWFKKQGIESRLTYDETKLKANLFATLGTETKGGLILSGHTDVVPVDGQTWDTDPFHTIEKDGKIYGRGTCDMKGFLAVVLALLPEFKQLKLKKPLHFAFSYDEEVGCLGVRSLIADLRAIPDACIVGEPTEMRPVIAHKGINVFRCKIEGRAAHSSLTPQGCNAIDYAAEFIQWLKLLASELKIELIDPDYDVPFTTLSTNLIQGGNAVNTIPASCEFTFEFRNLPEITPDTILEKIKKYIAAELLPKMQKEFPASKITIDEICRVPGLKNTHETSIAELVRQLTSIQTKHKVAYATEAGLFQQAGIPTVICGPGNIEQAHRANEYVEVLQIKKCEEFLRTLVPS